MKVFGRFTALVLLCIGAALLVAQEKCPDIPLPAIYGYEKICHANYVSFYDSAVRVPRLVAYELNSAHSLGCLARASGFHSEGDSARPKEYDGTGYDLGHMMPAEDNAWDRAAMHDSFSMVNVAPQLPGLNREEWERLEEDVRAWAWKRGDLLVYVGPVFLSRPKSMGDVLVPDAFFKVIVDWRTGEVLTFEMPQKAIAKGDVDPWRTPLTEIETITGIQFDVSQGLGGKTWTADLLGWRKAHKEACGRS